jgi:drug/metabolite transporter (DMT)-like permease
MDTKRIIAILLIIAGVLGLTYGGFSFTEKTHQADVGPIHLSVDEERHVNIPTWAGTVMLILGAVLLMPGKRT